MLSRLPNRNRYQFFLLDIGEWVFLIGEVAQGDALVPYSPTRTEVYSASCIANLADKVSCFVFYAMHHAVVPILYVFFVNLKAYNRSVPHYLLKGL